MSILLLRAEFPASVSPARIRRAITIPPKSPHVTEGGEDWPGAPSTAMPELSSKGLTIPLCGASGFGGEAGVPARATASES